ncbi:MAG: hypothetical protein JW748_01590 [Anaerolineales bacterium]|nr:hypothetical protein [Anaerolineales bacterium]
MRSSKFFLLVVMAVLVFSALLTACSGGGDSTATPGTGGEHSIPSAQAGYPAGGGNPTPEPGYPQP